MLEPFLRYLYKTYEAYFSKGLSEDEAKNLNTIVRSIGSDEDWTTFDN